MLNAQASSQLTMMESFVTINEVPTKVITFGRWVEDDFKSSDPKDIVLLIPGTVGITTFYTAFLETIHQKTGFPVWTVGHAGHEHPKEGIVEKIPPLKHNEKLYGLQGQIEHKIAFIEKYVPKDARIHLVGHSIGSHIILQLLQVPSINRRVVNSYLLFPAIEHMTKTRNGLLTKVIKSILGLILFFSWIFMFFPVAIQSFLIHVYMCIHWGQGMHLQTIRSFIDPAVLEKVFYMLYDEMEILQDRNNESIKANKDKIKFYYGRADGWVPIKYYESLKKDIPNVNAELCKRNFEHDFCLLSSVEVGTMVASWIRQ